MNGPAPAAVTAAETYNPRLTIADILTSKTNPRKRFDEAAMAELVDSIKDHGVVSPVLVRPLPAIAPLESYELVYGERRLRASKEAGLLTIPATIRELTDVEVIKIQIIENLQRADVHPIEEAEGYETLMKQVKPGTNEHYTPEEIAAEVGKSRTYIYNRMKLLDLCQEVRDAYFAGHIDYTKAHMIARIPHAKTQLAALKAMTQEDGRGETMTTRAAKEYVLRNFTLDLSRAPFDVTVVDYMTGTKPIAGACGPCPKRTGNNPDLFEDIKDGDICTDVKCFHAKRAAFHERKVVAFTEKGVKVVTGNEAKQIMPSPHDHRAADGFVSADTMCAEAGKTYGQLMGKKAEAIMVRRPDTDQYVTVYPAAEVTKVMAEKKIKPAPEMQNALQSAAAKASNAQLAEQSLERDVRRAAYMELREKLATGLGVDDWRNLVRRIVAFQLGDYETPALMLDLYAPHLGDEYDPADAAEAFEKAVAELPVEQLPRILFDLMLADIVDASALNISEEEMLNETFDRHGIDRKAIEKRLKAEAKANAKKSKEEVTQ